jgi:hypothetical protein
VFIFRFNRFVFYSVSFFFVRNNLFTNRLFFYFQMHGSFLSVDRHYTSMQSFVILPTCYLSHSHRNVSFTILVPKIFNFTIMRLFMYSRYFLRLLFFYFLPLKKKKKNTILHRERKKNNQPYNAYTLVYMYLWVYIHIFIYVLNSLYIVLYFLFSSTRWL